jgi:hypothetical protein
MNKLRRDLRVGTLGAAAGLFSVSVFLLIARIDAYYTYLEDITYGPYERRVEDLSWLPVAFWHTLLSIVASLAAHRYLSSRRSTPFLLWQAVGLVVQVAWLATFVVGVTVACLMSGNTEPLERMVLRLDTAFILKYVSVVFASYVLYGSVMQAASREYVEEPPALESSHVLPHRSFRKVSKLSPVAQNGNKRNPSMRFWNRY